MGLQSSYISIISPQSSASPEVAGLRLREKPSPAVGRCRYPKLNHMDQPTTKFLTGLAKNLNLTCSRALYQMPAFAKKTDVQSVDIVNDWFEKRVNFTHLKLWNAVAMHNFKWMQCKSNHQCVKA